MEEKRSPERSSSWTSACPGLAIAEGEVVKSELGAGSYMRRRSRYYSTLPELAMEIRRHEAAALIEPNSMMSDLLVGEAEDSRKIHPAALC